MHNMHSDDLMDMYTCIPIYIMNRVGGVSFRSNPTFFRGIKQVQTNTYPFIEKERGKGIEERIQKEAGK